MEIGAKNIFEKNFVDYFCFVFAALLSANIKTLQTAACETEELVIKCPAKTTIHIQFANYGRQVSSRERPCHNTAQAAASRSNVSIFHSAYDIDEESRECIASGSREVKKGSI